MRSQPAELQTLFHDVSHQLYTECKSIEVVQETVNACVKQSKELEAIHNKIEESHQRGERIRTEHSKEKLQSLTPQMLLTRLSLANTQEPAQGVDKLLKANMR